VKPSTDQSKGDPTRFSIILSFVWNLQNCVPLEFKDILEIDPMLLMICMILGFVPVIPHA